MTSQALNLEWHSPGPVATRFMASRARMQCLNGPIGSGKTTACLMKAITLAQAQAPSTTDTFLIARGQRVPVRKFKLCVVRQTYPELWKSTIASWLKRVPKDTGHFEGSEGRKAVHRVPFLMRDGTVCDLHVDFVAIGDQAVEDAMRGYEPTMFYLNEMDLLSKEVLQYASGRVGRFPDLAEGGCSWFGIIADCNAPELNNWVYTEWFAPSADDLAKRGMALFRQPSALGPNAENLKHLDPAYYPSQLAFAAPWYRARMLENRPGYSRAGKPCYPEFVDEMHVARANLQPVSGIPVAIGMDAGLNPAAVFGQRMPNGQWRICDELVGEQGMGPVRFGEAVARRLAERFGEIRTVRGWADPSAAYGADAKGGEQTWIEIVGAKTGIRISPAPTNRLIPRLEAVRLPLTRLIDGEPGFLLSPACAKLREGFAATYRFRRMAVGEDRYADEPEKNEASHPHDALQYLLSAGGEDTEIRERRRVSAQSARLMAQSSSDWDPHARGGLWNAR